MTALPKQPKITSMHCDTVITASRSGFEILLVKTPICASESEDNQSVWNLLPSLKGYLHHRWQTMSNVAVAYTGQLDTCPSTPAVLACQKRPSNLTGKITSVCRPWTYLTYSRTPKQAKSTHQKNQKKPSHEPIQLLLRQFYFPWFIAGSTDKTVFYFRLKYLFT